MPTPTLKTLIPPTLIGNTMTTLGTVGASKTWRVKEMIFMNDDTGNVLVDFHYVPSGGSPSATNKMFKGASPNGLWLLPGETRVLALDSVHEQGVSLRAIASVNNKVSFCASGAEIA